MRDSLVVSESSERKMSKKESRRVVEFFVQNRISHGLTLNDDNNSILVKVILPFKVNQCFSVTSTLPPITKPNDILLDR
jgi:hypothetical protein